MYPYRNRDDVYHPQSLTLPRPMRVAPPHGRPASSPSASGLRLVYPDQNVISRSAKYILIEQLQSSICSFTLLIHFSDTTGASTSRGGRPRPTGSPASKGPRGGASTSSSPGEALGTGRRPRRRYRCGGSTPREGSSAVRWSPAAASTCTWTPPPPSPPPSATGTRRGGP